MSDDLLMTEREELLLRIAANVPGTMDARPLDFELRDQRLAEGEVEEQVAEPPLTGIDRTVRDLDKIIAGVETDLDGNPITGEYHESDPRGTGKVSPDWKPGKIGLPYIKLAAFNLHVDNPTKAYHTGIMADGQEDGESMRAIMKELCEWYGIEPEALLANALKVGLLFHRTKMDEENNDQFKGG